MLRTVSRYHSQHSLLILTLFSRNIKTSKSIFSTAWLLLPVGLLVACKVEHFPQATDNERKGYQHYVEWTNSIITHESHSINRFIDCPFAHPSATFRKELIRKHGGYRNGDHPEDFELWLRWLSMGIRMEKIPEILLSWRDQPDRCSRVDPRYSQSAFHKIKASYLKQWLENELSLKERMIVCCGAGKIAKKMFFRSYIWQI